MISIISNSSQDLSIGIQLIQGFRGTVAFAPINWNIIPPERRKVYFPCSGIFDGLRTPVAINIISVAPGGPALPMLRCIQADGFQTPFNKLLIWYTGHGQASALFLPGLAGRQRTHLQDSAAAAAGIP